MSSIKEIIELEHSRQRPNELHLFAEGTFWRAYEFSAWLCFRCINEFKVTKRQIKGIEGPVCFVGFPQTSLEKWISQFDTIQKVDEKHILVELPDDIIPHEDEASLSEMFEIWKDNIELTISNKQQKPRNETNGFNETSQRSNGSNRLTDIMRDILAYPLEQKSPIDCMLYIAELKKRLSGII